MPSLGCCMDHYWCNSRRVCWCELFILHTICDTTPSIQTLWWSQS